MKYKFMISIQNGSEFEVFPTKIPKISLKRDSKTDELRKTLQGKLSIGGMRKEMQANFNEFLKIEQSEDRCSRISLKIIKKCDGTNIYRGFFGCNDGDWNIDNCKVEFKDSPLDDYTEILQKWGDKHNILDVQIAGVDVKFPKDLINPSAYNYRIFFDGVTPSNWAVLIEDSTFPIAYREETTTDYSEEFPKEPVGEGWTYFKRELNLAYWYRLPELKAIKENVYTLQLPANPPSPDHVLIRTFSVNSTQVGVFWKPRYNHVKVTTGRNLLEVLFFLLEKTAPNLLPATPNDLSDFFSLNTSYVHGNENEFKNVYVTDVTDFKVPFNSEPATENLISLKSFIADLESMFNMQWAVIGGKFRIEHKSYFNRTLQNDLTLSNPKALVGKNKYSFGKFEIPKKEIWNISNAVGRDFIGVPIEYESGCIDVEEENIKTHDIQRLSADVFNMVKEPSMFSDDAIAIFTIKEGKFTLDTGLLDGVDSQFSTIVNIDLAITTLHDKYHFYGRPLDIGKINGEERALVMTARSKKQTSITIPLCCNEPAWNELWGTQISKNAIMESAEIDLEKETVKVSLVHTIYKDGETSTKRQFTKQFDKSFS